MNERPRHLDLFSGIGGFSLAFEAEGFETIGFSEVDPFASAVLRKHWPGVTNYGDITKWREWPDIACDVITGGFPCQPFSNAGKRRGAEDDRFLWPSMLDVIGRFKPSFVLGENVLALVGMELDRCLSDLESIGFWTQSIIVPACAADRPIVRQRVFILAQSKRIGLRVRRVGENGNALVERRNPEVRIPYSGTRPRCGVFVRAQEAESIMGMADGLPANARGIKCYGNSVVPAVAQVFAKAIYGQLTN